MICFRCFDRGRPSRYLTENGWAEAEVQPSPIAVRGSAPVEFQVVRTRHGTIIGGDRRSGQAIALRTTTTDRPSKQWECLRPMLFARNVEELFDSTTWLVVHKGLLARPSPVAARFLGALEKLAC